MPIMRHNENGKASLQQLIRAASIYLLERRLIAAGRRGSDIWLSPDDWSSFEQPLRSGSRRRPRLWRRAIAALLAVIDFERLSSKAPFPPMCVDGSSSRH